MKLHRVSFALLTTLALSACSFAPDYKRPELPMPQEYTVASSADSIPTDWWTLFGDTTLNALVEEALNANQDLAAAAARVEQARAIAGVAKAQLYPELTAQGSGSRSQIAQRTAGAGDNPFNSFDLLGVISYELDFWGKLRNANKAAREDMLATMEGRRNVELAVVSDVASTYFDLLAFDRFDPKKVARYDARRVRTLLADEGIVRNRLKVESTIDNARAFLAVQKEFGTFDTYIWSFVGGKPIVNSWKGLGQIPALTKESDAMSKDLKKRGFRFVGSTICYAFMQATGMVNDHAVTCFRYGPTRKLR